MRRTPDHYASRPPDNLVFPVKGGRFLTYGEEVRFPREARRAAIANRGVELPPASWDRRRFTPAPRSQ